MAPPPHDQDTTSWLQLLGAIEEAEAGRGTARLTEICLSVYGALAAAQFQVTQLRARVHALAATRPCPPGIPLCQRVRGYRAQPGPVSRNEENAMGLPASEKRVPDTIENELRITDQQLAGAFAAFTRSAGGTPMPGPERLSARHRFMTRLRGWRTGWLRLTAGGRGGTGTQQAPKSWPGSPAAPTEGRSRPGPGRMHHPRPHPADRVITS